jgi:transcriptional regulator, XRE family
MSRVLTNIFKLFLTNVNIFDKIYIGGIKPMNRIAELRKKANITQEKFSSIIGVGRSTLAMYETNKSEPDFTVLQKIADYFDVSTDYLLGREEKSPPAQQEDKGLYIPEKYRDVMVAFSGGTDDLTQEDIDAIVRFIEFTKNNKKK